MTIVTQRIRTVLVFMGSIVSLIFIGIPVLLAQTNGNIDMSWHVLPGAGSTNSAGGEISVSGSLGQPGAGQSTGGNVSLTGGFWYPESSAPTAADVATFEAHAEEDTIRLVWKTANEIEIRGFNLYRGFTLEGPWVQLNDELIPSQTTSSIDGAAYDWLDQDVVAGAPYWYQLEIVTGSGKGQVVGIVSGTAAIPPNVSFKIWLPIQMR
jgi:hypothetical protein